MRANKIADWASATDSVVVGRSGVLAHLLFINLFGQIYYKSIYKFLPLPTGNKILKRWTSDIDK